MNYYTKRLDVSGTIIAFTLAIIIIVAASALGAWLFEVAWNYVVPLVFHGPVITFWPAWFILFLLSFVKGQVSK